MLRRTLTLLLAILTLAPAAGALAVDASPLVAGDLVTPILSSPGDLVVDGVVRAVDDLTVDVAGTLVVRGTLAAGHGAPGEPGGDLVIRARRVVVEDAGVLAAGAGGHGIAADVPGAMARGGDGGAGGSVRIVAESVQLDGAALPGAGGRGGDARGAWAVGGDGASPGLLLVNGEAQDILGLVPHEQPAMLLCIPTDIKPPQLVMGADGGDACADGIAGTNGAYGQDGQDDETTVDKASRPDCASFAVGWQDLDGEQGQDGFPGLPGGPALAQGGRGGDAVTTSMPAGDGGDAYARGGNGGNGGWGGMGGHSKGFGYGCRGGNGGAGANGGAATALAGAQGVNPLNCGNNGISGTPDAIGGNGGSGGYGGPGGGGNPPSHNGAHGYNGGAGTAGYTFEDTPPTLPCFAPDAPTLAASDDLLTCDAVRLAITAPAFTGNSAITHYKLYRGTSPGILSHIGDVVYTAVVTLALDQPLVTNQTYYYRAKAVTPVGESPYSYLASATPKCLTVVGIDVGNIGNILDPSTMPPVLAVAPTPGPSATLTITAPASILGTPQYYNIYRGPTSGGEVFLTTVPYGGATTTYVDATVLPLTAYWYYVTLTTSQDTSSDSNHAVVTTPLFMAGGGGNGNAQQTAGGVTKTCSNVPVTARFAYGDGSFALDARYEKGTGGARTDDPKLCASTDAQSRQYGNEGRSAAVARETGEVPACDEDQATRTETGWQVVRSCKVAAGASYHVVTLAKNDRATGWLYREVVTTYENGMTSEWRISAILQDETDVRPPRVG